MVMNESLFRGRLIKVRLSAGALKRTAHVCAQVTAKRTNVPGLSARGRGRGRGRGGRGRPFRARGRGRGWH